MKKNREGLEHILYMWIDRLSNRKKIQQDIIDDLIKHKIMPGDVRAVFSGNTALEGETDCFLYLFTKYLYNTLTKVDEFEYSKKELEPNLWFTEQEIKTFDNYKAELSTEKPNMIIIEDVIKMADDFYTTTKPIQFVVDLFNKRIVKYRFETQRDPRVRVLKDKVIRTVNVNNASVAEIKEELINGIFIPNHITINLLKNGEDMFKYDPLSRTLFIESGELNIIDGFHRSLAFISVISEYPNIERVTGINFTNFSVDKARKFIRQEEKRNIVDKQYLKSLNNESFETEIINIIKEKSNSELKGKIVTDEIYIIKSNALVLFSDLEDALRYNCQIQSRREATKLADYLVDGLNEIIGIKYKDFQNRTSVFSKSKVFIGYIALLSKIRNENDWKSILEEAMNRLDERRLIEILETKSRKKLVKDISEYFISILN